MAVFVVVLLGGRSWEVVAVDPFTFFARFALALRPEAPAIAIFDLFRGKVCGFDHGWEKVGEAYEVVDHLSSFDFAGPVGDERNVGAVVVGEAFAASDLFTIQFRNQGVMSAVVACEEDEGVVAEAKFFKGVG